MPARNLSSTEEQFIVKYLLIHEGKISFLAQFCTNQNSNVFGEKGGKVREPTSLSATTE
jgi:hypothetical protein